MTMLFNASIIAYIRISVDYIYFVYYIYIFCLSIIYILFKIKRTAYVLIPKISVNVCGSRDIVHYKLPE